MDTSGPLDPTVAAQAEAALLSSVDALWKAGWQPSEVVRESRRSGTSLSGRLSRWVVSADHARRPEATLHPAWRSQVEELELPRLDPVSGWLQSWARDAGVPAHEALAAARRLLAVWSRLPPIEALVPPPGSAAGGRSAWRAPLAPDDPVLRKVRALLAKAESTAFEAEAVSFTAKAEELMARHAIAEALLDARSGSGPPGDAPVATRVPIDEPYVAAKSLLLQVVAEAHRCRALMHPRLALSSIVGFAADVASVELLFTSLLVQAQSALEASSRHAPAGTRTRSRAYRSTFLLSYAQRIGHRLREVNESVVAEAEAEAAGALLPVLAARSAAVDDAVNARYGRLRESRIRGGSDAAGWAGGRAAADRARLGRGELGGDVRRAARRT